MGTVLHVVEEGEGISRIAARYGVFWNQIWSHPANAQLRAERPDPEVLSPGDLVTVPERQPRHETIQTGASHVFKRRGIPVRLRVVLQDLDGRPLAGRRYRLRVDGQELDGATGGDGLIQHWVQPDAREAALRVWLDPAGEPEHWLLQIGRLVPATDVRGLKERLRALGLVDDSGGDEGDTLDDAARTALRSYQRRAGLPVTGEIDAATVARLADERRT